MIGFKKYILETRSTDDKALEDAGRYVSRMVDLNNEMISSDPDASPEKELMYNMTALSALQNFFLGHKYGHMAQYSDLSSPEQKQRNVETIKLHFPHLVPHMERKITDWE